MPLAFEVAAVEAQSPELTVSQLPVGGQALGCP